MAELITLASLGLAAYYLAPVYSTNGDSKNGVSKKNAMEMREAMNYGFLRGTNTAKTSIIASEETRVIRAPDYNKNQVRENAAKSWLYQKEKNDMIAHANNGAAILYNRGTIRPSNKKRPGLLMVPTKGGDWGRAFGDIANVTYNIESGVPPEQMTTNWRDQYGDAGGFPREGRSQVVLNELYTGNPWGAGGQLFVAVGNQHRNPGYGDNPPESARNDFNNLVDSTPSSVKLKKRVRFSNDSK